MSETSFPCLVTVMLVGEWILQKGLDVFLVLAFSMLCLMLKLHFHNKTK
jgi:hypothetical protein